MARLPRLYVPDMPQLATASFARPLAGASEPTPARQLDLLTGWFAETVRDLNASIHGWVLLTDRLTILATPAAAQDLSRLFQAFGLRYATRLQHGRVYSGRYRSAIVQPGAWTIPALVWLETLPQRLLGLERAESWPWSSAASHIGAPAIPVPLTDHPDYWRAGNTPFERQARHRERLAAGLSASTAAQIEKALFGQWALGDADFLEKLGTQANRRATPAARGRPRKPAAPADDTPLPPR